MTARRVGALAFTLGVFLGETGTQSPMTNVVQTRFITSLEAPRIQANSVRLLTHPNTHSERLHNDPGTVLRRISLFLPVMAVRC